MPPSDAKPRVLVSIHDVSPRFETQVDLLYHRLEAAIGTPRLAMLVVPDFWNEAPLSRSPYRQKLRAWSDRGVEIFLHGWSHRDNNTHPGIPNRLKARFLSAREAEFLDLAPDEASARLRKGRDIVEDAIGRRVTGFVAPCWLYGEGALQALRDEGFSLAEDHWRIWNPSTGACLARSPVITWASRSRQRVISSLAFARIAPRIASGFQTLRLAVHPGDTGVPSLMNSIDNTIATLLKDRHPSRYADLAGP
jgi:predicted deacetylase